MLTPASPDPDVIRWADLGSVPQAWRIAVNRPLFNPAQAEGEESHPVEMLLQHAGRPSQPGEATADSELVAPSRAVPADLTVRVVAATADQEIAQRVGAR